ncbi:carboxy terminal-processing peptidase [Apibacter sp.]|uniref:carboxy terminal-processing peptidase n=1 Tax=Apibacter sp. TaxID=2023709 RepID=UPI0025F7D64D|nr:carboxy terminal-processing peptidase [Apibacter sp.]MCT6869259.1 carboxy terminal-processing peptidase [Apibacter sp.]
MLNLKKTWIFLSLCSMSLLVFCFNASSQDDREKEIFKRVKEVLLYSYSPKDLDISYSKDVYKKYIEDLDPFKRYFLESDMEEFSKYKDKMSDMFIRNDVSFYHLSIDRLYKRINETEEYVNDIFSKPITFTNDDYFYTDDKKRKFPKNKDQAKQYWKSYIKYRILQEIFNGQKEKDSINDVKELLENSDKDKDSKKLNKAKTKEELQKESVKKVQENLSEYFRQVKLRKKSDLFSIFVNAYTEVFDIHTTYFSPKDKENFNSSMSGKIIGIGATLQDVKGYPTIRELVIGGPAWKSKEIEAGDKIIKVQQGKKGTPISVVGMLLDDAIRLIRGEEKTTVVLTIEKKDGSTKTVSLVREEIEIQETFVRSAIITDDKGNKFGILYLPEFYVNLENNSKGRDCSDDVKKEILELKKQGIIGLIMDVRNNGGGSLSEVVDIAGLFVGKGPVVQVKDASGEIKVLKSKEKDIVWDGPLILMTNELSASASEILAGAMQDYKRAVVVGPLQTYGKGTVQTIIPLNRFGMEDDKFGALKITIQKFYRINGSSTQLKGVTSDIIIPGIFSYSDIFEKSQEFALPWDQIPSTKYTIWQGTPKIDYQYLKSQSEERLKGSTYISSIEKAGKWTKELDKIDKIPLKYEKFMQEMTKRRDQGKIFEKETNFDAKIKVEAPDYELVKFKTDTVLKAKREDWYKGMKKDFNLRESVNVLNDMISRK